MVISLPHQGGWENDLKDTQTTSPPKSPFLKLKIFFLQSLLLGSISVFVFYQWEQQILESSHSKKLYSHIQSIFDIKETKTGNDHDDITRSEPRSDPLSETASNNSQFYQKCSTLLHNGHWKNVTLDPNFPNNWAASNDFSRHQNLSLAGWANYYWSGPKSCGYKIYQPEEVRKCFIENYPEIIILGDSRGRQIYSALKPIVDVEPEHKSHFRMFDSAIKMEYNNQVYYFPNDTSPSSLNKNITQVWFKRSLLISQFLANIDDEIINGNRSIPNAIIIAGPMLHAVTQTGKEKDPKWARIFKEQNFIENDSKIELTDVEQLVSVILTTLAKNYPKMEIIYLEVEGIKPELYEFDKDRNQAFLGNLKRPFAMFRFCTKTVSQCFLRNAERSEAKIF